MEELGIVNKHLQIDVLSPSPSHAHTSCAGEEEKKSKYMMKECKKIFTSHYGA